MNFIPKNPNDPKYQEFHDGEYEFWPMDDTIKTKSISIPAAVVSGLELLAAAAAAGLLAVTLAVLYVTSSPLMIRETSALINTNVYNNSEDHRITYTLSSSENPDHVLQEETLRNDQQTLSLQNLKSGTDYLLTYYGPDGEEVGQFQFATPGEKQEPEAPEMPESPSPAPVDPSPVPTEPSSDATESAEATEPETQAPEETVPEETEVPGIGGGDDDPPYYPPYYPPAPPPEPVLPPELPPPPPPAPQPAPGDPSIGGFVSSEYVSGVFDYGDLGYTEQFVFLNLPDEHYLYEINRTGPSDYLVTEEYVDGTLTISVTGLLNFGKKISTEVTVQAGSETISKKSILTPPELINADLSVVPEGGNTYTFNVIATAQINDMADGIGTLVLEAKLFPYLESAGITVSMVQNPGDPTRYQLSAPLTVTIPTGATKSATVSVTGHWNKIGEESFIQNKQDALDFS